MKYLMAILLACLASAPALADSGCKQGSPDLFTFVKWEFKKVDDHWVDVNLTFHNNTDQAFSEANITIFVDGEGKFFVRSRELTKASGDGTATNQIGGMRPAEVKRFESLAPQLCVDFTYDESGTRKNY